MNPNILKTAMAAVLIILSGHLMAFTAVVSGTWSNPATWGGISPGASVSNQDVVVPTGITVDLDMNVAFSGVINSFTIDGTLNSSTNNNVSIALGAFAGSGSVNIHRFSFSGLLVTSTFSGNLNVGVLQNQGATITITALITIADTLDLSAGSTILGSGANLSMLTNSNVRVDDGSLTTSGGVFATGNPYDVWYLGLSKTTGLELNSTSLRDLHINMDDNLQILTQNVSNMIINGTLSMNMGQYDFSGKHLTLKSDLLVTNGTNFISNATSDLTIQGSGTLTGALMFSNGSSIYDLEIDRSANGNVKLGSALIISGTVFLTDGNFTLESGSTLTMNANSSFQVSNGNFLQNGGSFIGVAVYNVDYIGISHTSALELQGSGLNDVTVGLQAGNIVTLGDDVTINGMLDLQAGTFSLDGNDLTLNGTFHQDAIAVIAGDSNSTMTLNLTASTNDTFYFGGGKQYLATLDLNIPSLSNVYIATDLTIYDQIDMTSGKIIIEYASIHIRSTASINGYTDTKYIVSAGTGQLEQYINSNSAFITYPIGTMLSYAPAYIQQTSSGTSGYFKVRTMNGVYTQGTTGYNSAITESLVNKTWVIDAAALINVNMNLKLGWKSTDELNGFNRAQAHISHYMTGNWDTYVTGAATAGANNTYEITRSAITSLSPFAVVDTNTILAVADLTISASINIYPNPTAAIVTVETGDAHGYFLYEVFDATGKSIFSVSNSDAINRFDLSAYANGSYMIRITNTETQETILKQIIKS